LLEGDDEYLGLREPEEGGEALVLLVRVLDQVTRDLWVQKKVTVFGMLDDVLGLAGVATYILIADQAEEEIAIVSVGEALAQTALQVELGVHHVLKTLLHEDLELWLV